MEHLHENGPTAVCSGLATRNKKRTNEMRVHRKERKLIRTSTTPLSRDLEILDGQSSVSRNALPLMVEPL
jgi:hypothetical protein